MSKKTLYGVVIPSVVAIFVGAFAIGTDMFDYYCSAGSVFIGIDMSGFIYCKPVVYIVHVIIASLVVIAVLNLFLSKSKEKDVPVTNYNQSPHTEGGHVGDIVYGNKIVNAKKETESKNIPDINLEKLRLAEGGFINYPESKYHNVSIEEYTFTVVNETGHDLKKCFVLLDEFWAKEDWQTKGQWRLEAKDIFDKPFRWVKSSLPIDGKIDLDNNDKASFVLVELNRSSVLNVTENRNEPYLDFRLAMIDSEENAHALYTGWQHRLIITIRAKDINNKALSVKYSVYLRPHSAKGLEDIKVVREKQEGVS